MNKSLLKIFTKSLFVLLFVLIVIFCIFKFAFSQKDYGELIKSKKITTVINGEETVFYLESYRQEDEQNIYLVKKNMISDMFLELPGFENDVNLCEKNTVQITEDNDALCFTGEVGAHSQNLVLAGYQNGELKLIDFVEGDQISQNIISDVPLMKFIDIDNNNNIDLVVDNRNYDKDPLTESYRKKYLSKDGKFVFDSEENIKYYSN